MKIAIIHDWLTGMRGGEKCLEVFCELFPEATIFTLLHKKGAVSPVIENMDIKTSFIQKLPASGPHYRNYLPLFPRAIESFDLQGYDFILSSSHCVAKGVKPDKHAYHLCYCYTPMRYAWMFFDQYFGSYPAWKRKAITFSIERLKQWDLATLPRVNEFIAISQTVRDRIRTIYKREASVIYPPTDVESFYPLSSVKKEDFYLCVCALAPYKRVDVLIDAFNKLKSKKLYIVGDGQVKNELEKRKRSSNITFLGWVESQELLSLYRRAKAFVYVAEEDFGIAPIEAQAVGLPVIAYGQGGLKETVVGLNGTANNPTGLFFHEQTSDSLIAALQDFESHELEFSSDHIRQHALQFSRNSFKTRISSFIAERTKSLS